MYHNVMVVPTSHVNSFLLLHLGCCSKVDSLGQFCLGQFLAPTSHTSSCVAVPMFMQAAMSDEAAQLRAAAEQEVAARTEAGQALQKVRTE